MKMDSEGRHDRATILVVDDTPENIDVLRGLLKAHYKVQVAINGEQALKLCFSDQPPDLVLLDVMMPGMDGFEVCRRLKAEPRTEGMPVIFVTAMNEVRNEVQGFEAGGVDYINKPVTPAIVLARVKTHLQLRSAYRFIRDTFGRYLSDEIVDNLIDSPEGLRLGGEKRHLTIMMADLRGFTSIGERLPAETVVKMINIFLGHMTEIIQKHQGTIDEFIGDAILAIFGAPILREDDALRAVRCALEMQLAMQEVNRQFIQAGFPAIEMGIGINTGEVIVGNIGSKKRTKYGVVGRVVNTTSRIESYTIGGQILVSENTKEECRGLLRVDGQMEVMPKGLSEAITIYDIGAISGDEPVQLPEPESVELIQLERPVDVRILPMTGKRMADGFKGRILKLGQRVMQIMADQPCGDFSDLRIVLLDEAGNILTKELYVKVMRQIDVEPIIFHAHATSLSPVAERLFQTLCKREDKEDARSVRILHMTDFHIYTDPERMIKGICSNDSLAAVFEHAHHYCPDPDAIILGGDLAQDELPSTYKRLAAMLGQWSSPFMVTPGNHSSLPALRHTLIPALKTIFSYSDCLTMAGWKVIALNSHERGSVGGLLADAELDRLEQLLSAKDYIHALIAIHHHPVDIGSGWLDNIGLNNQDRLWSVIDHFPQVRAMICGHIHQSLDVMHGSVRILGTPSTCMQFMPLQDNFCMDEVSPGYRWLELLQDGSIRTGVERIEGFIPPDLNDDDFY
ncbi:MAG: adenylate/guanylate cyclase domain-containing protein [Mariprofundus sp.]|nr:adenylate/guanylate cyclase domain-containing protein [Mariprofundus sp.]